MQFQFRSQGFRTGGSTVEVPVCSSRAGEDERLSISKGANILYFFVVFGPPGIRLCPLTLVKTIYFTSLLIQMLVFSRGTFTDTHSTNILPAIKASLSPVKVTHNINHQICITALRQTLESANPEVQSFLLSSQVSDPI